jgi:hypothetical protein
VTEGQPDLRAVIPARHTQRELTAFDRFRNQIANREDRELGAGATGAVPWSLTGQPAVHTGETGPCRF